MQTKLKMVYWKSDRFWVGKLLEHPEIMTQGETLEELEENMRDAKNYLKALYERPHFSNPYYQIIKVITKLASIE